MVIAIQGPGRAEHSHRGDQTEPVEARRRELVTDHGIDLSVLTRRA